MGGQDVGCKGAGPDSHPIAFAAPLVDPLTLLKEYGFRVEGLGLGFRVWV